MCVCMGGGGEGLFGVLTSTPQTMRSSSLIKNIMRLRTTFDGYC